MSAMKLFGLLGNPVGHSLSPAMMNAAFAVDAEAAIYLPFAVPSERIGIALDGLSALGAYGVNVTIPHKHAAYSWVKERTDAALRVGAVNAVRFHPDGAIGHNTDVSGWWKSVADDMPVTSTNMVVIGAGGAAMAILAAMSLYRPNVPIVVIARKESAVTSLQRHFSEDLDVSYVPWDSRNHAISSAGVVIQTTPVGLWPHTEHSPVDDEAVFSPHQVVQDIVYRPLTTRFLQMAKQRGAKTIDGASMLIYQGVDAYEWWLSHPAPRREMTKVIYDALRLETHSS